MKVIKRDGRVVDYNKDKILIAIEKANNEVIDEKEKASKEDIKIITNYIEKIDKKRILVEDMQDIIEQKLMEIGKYELEDNFSQEGANTAMRDLLTKYDDIDIVFNMMDDLTTGTVPGHRGRWPQRRQHQGLWQHGQSLYLYHAYRRQGRGLRTELRRLLYPVLHGHGLCSVLCLHWSECCDAWIDCHA